MPPHTRQIRDELQNHFNQIRQVSGSIPPVSGSIPPVSGSIPPVSVSIPPVSGSIPPVSGSMPPVSVSIPPVSGSMPPVSVSIPPVSVSIPPSAPALAPAPTPVPASLEEITGKSQDIANDPKFAGLKVGVAIAGNAGLPGGSFGNSYQQGTPLDIDKPYSTQEESVIASWLKAVRANREDHNIAFATSLYNPKRWGLVHFKRDLGLFEAKKTIQGRDYTIPFWDITNNKAKYNQSENYNFCFAVENVPLYDSKDEFKRDVDLFFIFGPNVAASKKTFGSMARTKVRDYKPVRDYPVFRECVKTALRAALITMIGRGIEVAILPRVSGGIYSDSSYTRGVINSQYPVIINEILNEIVAGARIREYFKHVILTR